MNSRRRLIYYLLINVFVSALVAGSIIFYYDRNHHVECPAPLVTTTVQPGAASINVSMIGVIGAGTLVDERIIIQNTGTQELDLTGWQLTDNQGNTYTFPQLTLFPGVNVQLHTIAGKDAPSDLYWGRAAPVWVSGELAALYDTQGIARAFYRIP
jgi:Lamin Tail Domain